MTFMDAIDPLIFLLKILEIIFNFVLSYKYEEKNL